MPAARILVVEDDHKTAELVALYLRHAMYDVHVEHSGTRARARIAAEPFDVLVLDVMLPGVDGLTLCREARAAGNTAIILLTARTLEDDRIAGLELGADDYVPKPFSPRELVARVQAVLRRVPAGTDEPDVVVGNLRMSVVTRLVHVADARIDLTNSEFALLLALARRPGHVLSRAQLLGHLPGGSMDSLDRTVDVHIRNIRRKLEPFASAASLIQTVSGVGYRLAGNEQITGRV